MTEPRLSRYVVIVSGFALGGALGLFGIHLLGGNAPGQGDDDATPAPTVVTPAPASPAPIDTSPCAPTAKGIAAWNALALKTVKARFPKVRAKVVASCTGHDPRRVVVSVGPLGGFPAYRHDRELLVLRNTVVFHGPLEHPRIGISPVPSLQVLALLLIQVRNLVMEGRKAGAPEPVHHEHLCFLSAAGRGHARITCRATEAVASLGGDAAWLTSPHPCADLPAGTYCVSRRYQFIYPMMYVPTGKLHLARADGPGRERHR